MAETGADVSVAFVPPAFTKDACIEAIDAGIGLLVVITEGVPVQDTAEVWAYLDGKETRMIGPNCPGIITPGESLAGITPATIAGKGPVGLVSKSGTLTYQMMFELRDYGFSTAIGIGGDPIVGTTHIDALAAFEADPETKAIVMIGEIGGDAEERAAAYIKDARHQAGRRLRRRLHRPRGQDDGPRRRHRVRLVRHRAGQEGGPRGRRRQGRQDAVRDRRADAGDPPVPLRSPLRSTAPPVGPRHCRGPSRPSAGSVRLPSALGGAGGTPGQPGDAGAVRVGQAAVRAQGRHARGATVRVARLLAIVSSWSSGYDEVLGTVVRTSSMNARPSPVPTVKMPPPSLLPERAKVAEFYSAITAGLSRRYRG